MKSYGKQQIWLEYNILLEEVCEMFNERMIMYIETKNSGENINLK